MLESVDPPTGETSAQYGRVAAKARVRTSVVYASELEGDLRGTPARQNETPRVRTPRERPAMDLGGFGVVVAIGLVVALLMLWLKFGGGGALLAREPRDDTRRKHATPDAWKMNETDAKDADGLLAQIAQMKDRTAAMVLLLRHCLLAAARATDARFARSDTERLAFGRLPHHWSHRARLESMLHYTELVHYGGREVAEDRFEDALDSARRILGERRST